MSVIDVQNAKQIRDPMTVLIKMEVPEDVDVSFSSFAHVKLKDEELEERSWPMRALADLQGDGFALDGSRALYDPTVTPSATNGKLGVRGDTGEELQFTVTGDSTINGLSILATGAEAVRYNGRVSRFSEGQIIIPVGAASITLEFIPEESDERVEVSFVRPGTRLEVSNETIISCVVSLRSDLTIEEPTLPESEINIDLYSDADLSEVVATIPDDTPITYSAGYLGDMSPERKFYVSGQVTWADNVLSINGVDAVHFLDAEVPPYELMEWYENYGWADDIGYIIFGIRLLIGKLGVSPDTTTLDYAGTTRRSKNYYFSSPRCNLRELIAQLNNILKMNVPNSALNYNDYPVEIRAFWFNYVDAGIPKLTSVKPAAARTIMEEDCSDLKKDVEIKLGAIHLNHKEAAISYNSVCGQVNVQKDGTGFPTFDKMTYNYAFCFGGNLHGTDGYNYISPFVLPIDSNGYQYWWPKYENTPSVKVITPNGSYTYGRRVFQFVDESTPQGLVDSSGGTLYTQVVPAGVRYRNNSAYGNWRWPNWASVWNSLIKDGRINSGDGSVELVIKGNINNIYDVEKTFRATAAGKEIEMEGALLGSFSVSGMSNFYPDKAYRSLFDRSNITGSFTWKGDPRLQPRDVVEFHRLDGSVDVITLENITLHHEGGGTYAEITYREGVC